MNGNSKKNSAKTSTRSSKINSPRLNTKSKSSVGMLREDNTVDTSMLKTNLQEFFKQSKEKLIKIKNDIDIIDCDNERQKEENNRLAIRGTELRSVNEELQLRLKGAKEKLIAAKRHKSDTFNHIRDNKKEIESITRKVETMKIDTNYKVKMIQNEITHINVVKENNVESLKKKIKNEEAIGNNLHEKIDEIMNEIHKYRTLISELSHQDTIRAKELSKETAEMTKFLSEL